MITEFKLFENRRALDVKHNFCKVCGTEGEFTDRNDLGKQYEDHYDCDNCDFKWYVLWSEDEPTYYWSEENNMEEDFSYSIEGVFTLDGDKVEYDEVITNKFYDETKLTANKYNL